MAPFVERTRDFQNMQRRKIVYPKGFAFHRDGTVFVSVKPEENVLQVLGCEQKIQRDTPDQVILAKQDSLLESILQERGVGTGMKRIALHEVALQNTLEGTFAVDVADEESFESLLHCKPLAIFLKPTKARLHKGRKFFDWIKQNKIEVPVILNFHYDLSKEDLVIQAAAECGALLADGLGDGLFLEGNYPTEFIRTLSFGVLQAARMRSVKTDFISCPSCGRTLFDLQEVTRNIRERTGHLAGVKIAVMGCIVNGPGEMADAHFGYVGSKPGMIDLFVGKECVEKNIASEEAVDRLIALIRSHGLWEEPQMV